MSTNRPALSNFFAAFRAHTANHPTTSTSIIRTSSAVIASAQAAWSQSRNSTSISSQQSQQQPQPQPQQQQPQQQQQQQQQQSQQQAASAPRPIDTRKAYQSSTPQPTQPTSTQMYNAYPPLQHAISPLTHGPRAPPSPSQNTAPTHRGRTQYPTLPDAQQQQQQQRRRGSDSSSDGGMGFRDTTRGGEKWYIGGWTAGGEERFYRLGMATRDRSADRLSADRMSL